ncbi:MAG: low molecular weight protein-tyrosine-phosphatase [Chloroflexota bacterium]
MRHVLILCHGNICRSPLAEVLLEAAIAADPELAGRVSVSSAGTSDEHEGEGMHANSAALLAQRGLRTRHRARRLTPAIAGRQDLILVADRFNLRDGRAVAAATEQKPTVRLLRDFDPQATGEDLDDPWSYPIQAYERTASEISAAIPGILNELRLRV